MSIESALVTTPIRVLWLGWDSDTFTLRRKGWKVSASYNPYGPRSELVLVDPMQNLALVGTVDLTYVKMYHPGAVLEYFRNGVELKGYKATDRAVVHSLPGETWNSWDSASAIDGMAYLSERNISELNIFKFEQPREIIIPALSVDECLNQILKIQFPEQKLIKELDRKVVAPKAEVKIYSLVG